MGNLEKRLQELYIYCYRVGNLENRLQELYIYCYRVGNLENRLQELSSSVAEYQRLRESDQADFLGNYYLKKIKSTFFTLQRFGPSLAPNFKYIFILCFFKYRGKFFSKFVGL